MNLGKLLKYSKCEN